MGAWVGFLPAFLSSRGRVEEVVTKQWQEVQLEK